MLDHQGVGHHLLMVSAPLSSDLMIFSDTRICCRVYSYLLPSVSLFEDLFHTTRAFARFSNIVSGLRSAPLFPHCTCVFRILHLDGYLLRIIPELYNFVISSSPRSPLFSCLGSQATKSPVCISSVAHKIVMDYQ